LPYRNDAAIVLRRLIRSLPQRQGVMGVATCDKGLPAMMMALAGTRDLPCVLVPGGVTLLAEDGEDAGKVQSIGARFAHGQITVQQAAEMGCRACGSPGGGCQFLGTAATSQVVAEALGMALTHSALAPSGHPIWHDMARRSGRAVLNLEQRGIRMRDILTEAALHNAMVTHAAFGGSTSSFFNSVKSATSASARYAITPRRTRPWMTSSSLPMSNEAMSAHAAFFAPRQITQPGIAMHTISATPRISKYAPMSL
jgi:dihydroxyacid dehydratase/phosphogluconate dehydratase